MERLSASESARLATLPRYPLGQYANILLLSCEIEQHAGAETAALWMRQGEEMAALSATKPMTTDPRDRSH
ncbi:MAG: hypothetical protein EBR73_16500 [Rhodobacteraceae bacterium]|nr:hypothetical protein [Paracoccaceae bacterium]